MRSWEEHNNHIIIKTPEAFNFKVNLDYLQRDHNECMFEIENDRITRVIEISNVRTLVRIRANEKEDLDVEFLANTKPALFEDKESIVGYICEWFDLDNNIIRRNELCSKAI
ncbi:hypothetical protein MUN88_10220 [Gracilibacillus caseinilyticus]|uniref:Uncharacterized protein n=1 Tax=Gracilibacillus caseinilyticus TaxID=2932256 RepID=A0ABY4F1V8_9BACI|nr:hypothetical protein [Gracilibacillus caseinilyticus]UOQ50677.1 hypothetical protein MUN88_10220 [Gracilibacillus caseinilyticus]